MSFKRNDSSHKSVARGMPRTQRYQITNIMKAILVCSLMLAIPYINWPRNHSADGKISLVTQHRGGAIPPNETSDLCPQTAPLLPAKYAGLARKLDIVYGDGNFKLAAYNALGGAVQIPCGPLFASLSFRDADSGGYYVLEQNHMMIWVPLAWIRVGTPSLSSTSIWRIPSLKCEHPPKGP